MAEGCREVVLTGIHLSSYGVTSKRADGFVLEEGKPLQELIRRVNAIPGVERIRLGSLEPRIITEAWLEGLKSCKKLCPHFHLSLQSGCDETLARMNRHYTRAEYRDRVELLRSFYEHPAITTDVIVGFPGETDEEFRATESFLEEIGFSDLHIFQYSMRDGTRAASMAGQVPPEVKKARSEALLARIPDWKGSFIEKQEREEQDILFEEYLEKDGNRFLVGYNSRYVRYGTPACVAEREGYAPGECFSVTSRDRIIF